jgi:uncharacterized protein (DUF1800 family)
MKTFRCLVVFLASFAALAVSLPNRLSAQEARLANLATTSQVGSGANVLTVGFVVTGTAKKNVLVRGVGPGLAVFKFTGTLADPVLTLFSGGTPIATNDNWGTPVNTTPITAATFSAVGAFALPAGSKDAAMVVALDPGSYTAQLSGAGSATGLAIVEVYELDTAGGKLTNLSTTGPIAAGGTMIAGLVIAPGSGARKLLIRAAGPALGTLGLPSSAILADPSLTITSADGKTTFATNDNWGTPTTASALDAASLATIAQLGGGFAFPQGSKDAMAYVELAAGSYTVLVTGLGTGGGLATVEVYDLTPATPATVSIAATKPTSDESGNNNGEFTITRAGDVRAPLTVSYGVGGSAVNGFDYAALPGSVTIPAGATSVKLPVQVIPDLQTEGLDSVIVTISNNSSYTVSSGNTATVTIADSPATLYISSVRPTGTATASAASGTASILLSSSGTLAGVNVNFSNLSSAEVTAHLVVGSTEDYVFTLPQGQVAGTLWTFAPTGPYNSAALLAALKSGNVSVRIDSANYPAGELKGTFIQGTGSQAFTAPAAPPAVSLTGVTAADAARFLTQATFGPTRAEIDALTGGSIDAWITSQMALPFTSHRTAILADQVAFGGSSSFTNWNAVRLENRQAAWFKNSLTAPDQLRQRVAFALSELFVVSDVSLGGDNQAEPLAAYYDILGNGAFGSFRTLLENVTLNPMMGNYLSSLRNSKADPVTGQTPDENYAREVMQLFTIGLNQLQPDGTLALGSDGLPIPTYSQITITQMAKVFTGWGYPSTNANAFRSAPTNYFLPMQNFASNHDTTLKDISPVSITPIPAGQTGPQDLAIALDALFTHANTAPFVAKHLIQRLVTSNPSPGYVYRVAQKFVNDGTGARGNLAAVVRAVLTDYEARSPAVASTQSFGKLKEPLMRLMQVLRAFGASAQTGRFSGFQYTVSGVAINGSTPLPALASSIGTIGASYQLANVQNNLAEAALRSPTVFNFFHPDYVLPGPLASAGLVVPEFEITDDNYAINVPNFFRTVALTNLPTTTAAPYTIVLNLAAELALVSNPSALLDHLNLVLCAGNMPAATKTSITSALASMAASTTATEKTQTAVLLTLTSPASAVQK